jgi:hypothetical protein
MRYILAAMVLIVSTVPALAVNELNGKWVLSNGNSATITNGVAVGRGYGNGQHSNRWTVNIRKTGPNTYQFYGGDYRDARTCTLSGRTLRCAPFGASWRRR